jgi:hypothetical protein
MERGAPLGRDVVERSAISACMRRMTCRFLAPQLEISPKASQRKIAPPAK